MKIFIYMYMVWALAISTLNFTANFTLEISSYLSNLPIINTVSFVKGRKWKGENTLDLPQRDVLFDAEILLSQRI